MKKIVILFPEFVGDFVMLIPALHRLKAAYPESKIVMWCSQSIMTLVSWHPVLDEVHNLDPIYDGRLHPKQVISFISYLKKSQFDICYFTNDPLFWVVFLAGIPVKVREQNTLLFRLFCHGSRHEWAKDIFRHAAKRGVNNIDNIAGSRLPDAQFDFSLDIPESDVVSRFGLTPQSYIFYNPDGNSGKKYLPAFYSNVLQMMIDDGHTIVVGGISDRFNLQAQFESHPQVCFVTGKTTFVDFFHLVKNAKMVVTNDSGPSHVACIFKVKSLVFHPSKNNRPAMTNGFDKDNYSIKYSMFDSHCDRYCACQLRCSYTDCDRDYELETIRTLFKTIVRSEGRSWKEKRFETLRQSVTIALAGNIGHRETAWVKEMTRQGLSIGVLDMELQSVSFSNLMTYFQRYGVQILHIIGYVPLRIKLWILFLRLSERWYLKVATRTDLPNTAEEILLYYLNVGSDYRYSSEFESLTGEPVKKI